MKLFLAAAAAASLLASTGAATAATTVLIDFEDQAAGSFNIVSPLVYPQATFSSSTGSIHINGAGLGKDICAIDAARGCIGTTTVTFAGPVNNLSFLTVGDNQAGANIFATVTTLGGVFNWVGHSDGNTWAYDLQDLSAFVDVTALSLSSSDPYGVAYDNFRFDAAVGGGVPEPATWALMIAGFGLAGAGLRQRRAVVI